MTGDELLKLKEMDIFKAPVMDVIINEFEPDTDAFMLTDAFLPFKLVDKSKLFDLINNGAFGTTTPTNLDADHRRISIPGHSIKEHNVGHWREGVLFGEAVLQEAIDPANPSQRMGEKLVGASLNMLDIRLNNLIEKVTSKVVLLGSYTEARNGVNYTYNAKIPAKHYKNVTSTPGWTTGGTWATAANATPISDVIGAIQAMRRMGLEPETVYMNVVTLEKFYKAADTQAMVKASPVLVGLGADRKRIFNTLTGIDCVVDSRLYAEETRLTADSAASDTVLDVENASEFVAGEKITLRTYAGEEEEATIDSISGNAITLVAGITNAMRKGDRVTVYKNFMPDNYFVLKGATRNRVGANNWVSTPSIVKSKDWLRPEPGRYTWTHFQADRPPYTLEIGAGISGGPRVSAAGWMTVKVVA